jgi:hypothetical protein
MWATRLSEICHTFGIHILWKRFKLFVLAEDLGAGVWDGDAHEFVVGIEPEVPVGTVGLQQEVTEALRTAVERHVLVTLEFDEDLGGGAAMRNEHGKAGAGEVAAISVGARLAR